MIARRLGLSRAAARARPASRGSRSASRRRRSPASCSNSSPIATTCRGCGRSPPLALAARLSRRRLRPEARIHLLPARRRAAVSRAAPIERTSSWSRRARTTSCPTRIGCAPTLTRSSCARRCARRRYADDVELDELIWSASGDSRCSPVAPRRRAVRLRAALRRRRDRARAGSSARALGLAAPGFRPLSRRRRRCSRISPAWRDATRCPSSRAGRDGGDASRRIRSTMRRCTTCSTAGGCGCCASTTA